MTPGPARISEILARSGDPALEAIVRLAGHIADGSGAGVHILDDRVQHRIAGHNAPVAPHPREDSMCRLVVESGERIVTGDASQEQRFGYSSFVRGDEPGVRRYVSTPLRMDDGALVGTLCAWDADAGDLTEEQVAAFDDLALLAAAVLQRPTAEG
ncbi:GAF domain-containing protein [Miltoncostaea oceani]|uniref:GAF domain-containing protein n=1 Tax=Miltoncostaea oceani TaxID=2843216 RepID=UPI001C3DB47A|nr:GAF domain-containing protein [Miltoncostaea oceani]